LKNFDDVKNCKNVEEFNMFAQEYLDERTLKGEKRKKHIGLCSIAGKRKLKIS